MQLRHLEQAKERGAPIMSAGDFFCAMQGKWDRRSSKADLRPEHRCDNYLDALVTTAADFFAPYANQFVTIAVGNHEQSIVDHHETNLIERLIATLHERTGSTIYCGGFSGWIIFQFKDASMRAGRSDRNRIVLHYDHGYGGGGPVTADMIQYARRAVYLPDADILVSGHTHDAWSRDVSRLRLSPKGVVRQEIQTHLKIPSYKDDYGEGFGGWTTTKKGLPPKPLGAYWLRFFWDRPRCRFGHEVIRAQ